MSPSSSAPSSERELRAGAALPPERFEPLRRQAILRHHKWDPQVGDQATLATFPLIVTRACVDRLFGWAEALDREARDAEAELLGAPQLWERLAVPRAIRQELARGRRLGLTPDCGRVMRFDFHPCREGWRISEVNADVPGGYSESTELTRLFADVHPGLVPSGAPGERWCDAIVAHARASSGRDAPRGALVYATGFTEDLQVCAYLADHLRARGCTAVLAQPQHLRWTDGRAHLEADHHRGPLDFIVRFFQCEWLPRLPRAIAWRPLVAAGRTPVANPGLSVLLESKRFPLAWPHLRTGLSTWRALLPETRTLPWRPRALDASWVLKSAYSNNGDDVLHRALTPAQDWRRGTRWLFASRGSWLAQRRFEPEAIDTPWGSMHVCLGVYTVDGRAAGIYGRLSHREIVDFRATDVAVLVDERGTQPRHEDT
jgi:hypothetical protein